METYEEMQKKEIYFKVSGKNKTNEVLNFICPKLLNVFKDEVGKQIFKASGDITHKELLKKYQDKTDLIIKEAENCFNCDDFDYMIYLKCFEHSVYVHIQIRFNNVRENGFIYYQNSKYILNTRNLKLLNLYEFKELKEINPDEEYKTFLNCLDILNKLNEEKGKFKLYELNYLPPF